MIDRFSFTGRMARLVTVARKALCKSINEDIMSKPLDGIRVLELGQLLAGPFAAKMLGEFGAEVIKIEPPLKGDPLRNWRLINKGTPVWWAVQTRHNKRVTYRKDVVQGKCVAVRQNTG